MISFRERFYSNQYDEISDEEISGDEISTCLGIISIQWPY